MILLFTKVTQRLEERKFSEIMILKLVICIYFHLFFLIPVWSFNPVGATAELIRWKYSEAPNACSLVAGEVGCVGALFFRCVWSYIVVQD